MFFGYVLVSMEKRTLYAFRGVPQKKPELRRTLIFMGVKKILGGGVVNEVAGAERVTAVGFASFMETSRATRDRRSRGTGTPALRFSAVELEPQTGGYEFKLPPQQYFFIFFLFSASAGKKK